MEEGEVEIFGGDILVEEIGYLGFWKIGKAWFVEEGREIKEKEKGKRN